MKEKLAVVFNEERKEERAEQMVVAWGDMVRKLCFDFHFDKLYQDSKGFKTAWVQDPDIPLGYCF